MVATTPGRAASTAGAGRAQPAASSGRPCGRRRRRSQRPDSSRWGRRGRHRASHDDRRNGRAEEVLGVVAYECLLSAGRRRTPEPHAVVVVSIGVRHECLLVAHEPRWLTVADALRRLRQRQAQCTQAGKRIDIPVDLWRSYSTPGRPARRSGRAQPRAATVPRARDRPERCRWRTCSFARRSISWLPSLPIRPQLR